LLGWRVLICTLGAFVAAGSADASASTRYVSSSGQDSDNDCTAPSDPCLTVQYAVDQADAGDTVAVAGPHDETVRVRLSLTITQWAGEAPGMLDGSDTSTGDPVVWVDGTDTLTPPVVSFVGLTVENDPSNDGILVTGHASLTVEDSTISHNAERGIEVQSGSTVDAENSTVSNNSDSGIFDPGTATIVRSTITGNIAPSGAGIYVDPGGKLLVADSTLTGNASSNTGGALVNLGSTTVENSTIAHNSSGGGSAIATANTATVTLAGDIVAKQTSGSDCSALGGVIDDGYNLDDDGSCISSTSPREGSHDGTAPDGSSTYGAVLDAYLADSLGNNGGPTQTLALLNNPTPATTQPNPALAVVPASYNLPVAVNAGSAACSVPDQRDVTPTAGIDCDIGAYLLQATRTRLATSSGVVRSGVRVTYTAAITPVPDGGTVAFSDGAGNPATVNCPARPLTGGEATCTVSYPASGVLSVTATYSSDGTSNHYAGSTSSPPLKQTVITSKAPGPRLSHLHVKPHKFQTATKGKPTDGTGITYRDTLAADTTLRVYRKLRGAKRGGKCVAKPKGNPRPDGKPCMRLVLVGTFMHHDKAGANRLHFTGRIRGHALRPGSYELEVTAKLAGRHSNMLSGSFVIIALSAV
jgi:parallel beta-helix repeat protein